MCFSPSVSFAASALLGIAGILTLKKVKNKNELLFAAIPLLFSVQQFIEGMLWLALLNGNQLNQQYLLTQSYTIFAGMLWPVMVPLSIWLMEKSCHKYRIIMIFLLTIGTAMAIYTLTNLLQSKVTARIADYCILYEHSAADKYSHIVLIFYILATCPAFFLSSHREIRWLGAANLAALAVAYIFYNYHMVSVWCLFAAIVSGFIYLYFYQREKHRMRINFAI